MDAAQVIAKTMAAAKRPLTEDQQILLAGALAVCLEKAVAAERERCAQICRDLWNEQEAAHGNRAGEYHNGLTAGLDLAERRIRFGA